MLNWNIKTNHIASPGPFLTFYDLMTSLTRRSLSHGLHDELELLEGQHAVLVPVKKHEDLLELRHLRQSEMTECQRSDERVPALRTVSTPPGQCWRSDRNFLSWFFRLFYLSRLAFFRRLWVFDTVFIIWDCQLKKNKENSQYVTLRIKPYFEFLKMSIFLLFYFINKKAEIISLLHSGRSRPLEDRRGPIGS